MAPEEAVEKIYGKEIQSSENPDAVRKEKLAQLMDSHYNYPYHGAELAMVNEIIDPRDTRPLLINMLDNLSYKKVTPRPWRKHSLISR